MEKGRKRVKHPTSESTVFYHIVGFFDSMNHDTILLCKSVLKTVNIKSDFSHKVLFHVDIVSHFLQSNTMNNINWIIQHVIIHT